MKNWKAVLPYAIGIVAIIALAIYFYYESSPAVQLAKLKAQVLAAGSGANAPQTTSSPIQTSLTAPAPVPTLSSQDPVTGLYFDPSTGLYDLLTPPVSSLVAGPGILDVSGTGPGAMPVAPLPSVPGLD